MLCMYIGMRTAFTRDHPPAKDPRAQEPGNPSHTTSPREETSAHVEIFFSSLPKHFSLTHPTTGKILIQKDNPESAEWSGNIILPYSREELTSTNIEIQGTAQWSEQPETSQFFQANITPDELGTQSQTLRAESDIIDIMTFQWKEEE